MNVAQHKFKMLTVSLLVLLILLGFAIYQLFYAPSPHASEGSPIFSTFTTYPLELKTQLNKTEFQEGEMVSTRISLKNISNQTVIVYFSSARKFAFDVTDMNGKVVYSSLIRLFIQEVTPVTLEPNAETSWTITQNAEDNFPPENLAPLPKGTYRLIGQTGNFGAQWYESWEYTGVQGRLKTPPITITVN